MTANNAGAPWAHDPVTVLLSRAIDARFDLYVAEVKRDPKGGAGARLQRDLVQITERAIRQHPDRGALAEYLGFMMMVALVQDKGIKWYAPAYSKAVPLANKALRREAADRAFGEKGAGARRVYSDDQRHRWRALYATKYAKHSQRHAAELIVATESLPPSAVETVRKALRKENG